MKGSPVEYPSILVGGKSYELKHSQSAIYQLNKWGWQPGDVDRPIPIEAWAASMAGTVDPLGNWTSAEFKTPVQMLDRMTDTEPFVSLVEPVFEALKKVMPGLTLDLNKKPANEEKAA